MESASPKRPIFLDGYPTHRKWMPILGCNSSCSKFRWILGSIHNIAFSRKTVVTLWVDGLFGCGVGGRLVCHRFIRRETSHLSGYGLHTWFWKESMLVMYYVYLYLRSLYPAICLRTYTCWLWLMKTFVSLQRVATKVLSVLDSRWGDVPRVSVLRASPPGGGRNHIIASPTVWIAPKRAEHFDRLHS